MSTEVLIPHLDRVESLRRTLESLRVQTERAEVCVIDNGSSDETLAVLARDFPEVRPLPLRQNFGFGAAVNRGLRTSSADLVVLLNNDAIADERFIAEIHAERERSGVEMIAGCMRSPDGPIESLGVEVDRSLVAYDTGYGEPYPAYPEITKIEPLGPSGGAAAFDRAALVDIGGFDEAIFAYLEDVELAIRMRVAGMRCESAWRAFVWHEHSATLGSGSPGKNRLMGQSRGYLLWKHGAGLTARERLRGHVIDAVVYAGQAALDRNADALRGRFDARRSLRGATRPPAERVDDRLTVRRSLLRGLALRRSRRG